MKTEEAHQIANENIPKILEYLKYQIDIKGNKCVLQGILIAQEKELEFLEDFKRNNLEFDKELNDRLEALKISNEDLRKVLK